MSTKAAVAGGDAGEVAEEVERHPLGGEDGAGRPFHFGHDETVFHGVAVGGFGVEADRRIDCVEGGGSNIEAGQNAGFARDEIGGGHGIGGNRRGRGDVPCPAEILLQRGAHGLGDQQIGQAGQFAHAGTGTRRAPTAAALMASASARVM